MSDFFSKLPPERDFTELAHGVYRLRLREGQAWAEVRVTSLGHYEIATIFTEQRVRGRGLATRLLERLTQLADRQGATLVLKPASFDETAMATSALRSFYERFGFQGWGPDYMVRRADRSSKVKG